MIIYYKKAKTPTVKSGMKRIKSSAVRRRTRRNKNHGRKPMEVY